MVIAVRLEINNCVVLPGSTLHCTIEFINVEPVKLEKIGTLKKLFQKKPTNEQPISKSSAYYYTSKQNKIDPIATIESVYAQVYGLCSADSMWLKELKTVLIDLDDKYNDHSDEKDIKTLIVRTSLCFFLKSSDKI